MPDEQKPAPPPAPAAAAPQPQPARRRGKQRQNGGRKPGQGRWSRNPGKTGGKPSDYRKANNKMALRFAKLGMRDEAIAEAFSVSIGTLYCWKRKHPLFKKAIETGRVEADGEVVHSLYKCAVGYKHKTRHFSAYQGVVTQTPYTEDVLPDVGAQALILKAHHRAVWGDKSSTEISGPGGQPLAGPRVIVITHEAMAAALPPPVDLPPSAVSVSPAAAPARLTVSREESPRTAQVAPDQVPAPTPAQSAPGASWRKPERVAGGVAADRLPERQPVKASLDAGVAESLLGKLAALDGNGGQG